MTKTTALILKANKEDLELRVECALKNLGSCMDRIKEYQEEVKRNQAEIDDCKSKISEIEQDLG